MKNVLVFDGGEPTWVVGSQQTSYIVINREKITYVDAVEVYTGDPVTEFVWEVRIHIEGPAVYVTGNFATRREAIEFIQKKILRA